MTSLSILKKRSRGRGTPPASSRCNASVASAGVVVTVKGRGSDAEATVRFEDAGEKHLLLAYVPLRKVG